MAAQATLTDRAKLAAAQVADDIERARAEVRLAAAFDAHQVLADSFADLERRCDALDTHVISASTAAGVPESCLRRALRRRLARPGGSAGLW